MEGCVLIIVVMSAVVGCLCVMAGAKGLLEGAALPEAALNLGIGLLTVLGVAFLFKRRHR